MNQTIQLGMAAEANFARALAIVSSSGSGSGSGTISSVGGIKGAGYRPSIVLQTIVTAVSAHCDGHIIKSLSLPWLQIAKKVAADPYYLYGFAQKPREFEEFLAACYDEAGFDEVVLTPRSGDRGRDVIAIKNGMFSLRILDQAKAYKAGHLVSHNDVRAMLGTLDTDSNSSKGIITTTSDFCPNIMIGPEFKRFMPYRLDLVNGTKLGEWIVSLSEESQVGEI